MSAHPYTCGKCYHWAPLDKRRFMGVCNHRDKAGCTTDKLETCDEFEEDPTQNNEKTSITELDWPLAES